MNLALKILKNKYLISTTAVLVWLLFFDHNDLFSQYDYYKQVVKLREKKTFYIREITQVEKEIQELTSNPTQLEKFAREKYLMKKSNEDLFVITTP